jgi:hypothetical protein
MYVGFRSCHLFVKNQMALYTMEKKIDPFEKMSDLAEERAPKNPFLRAF